MAASAAGMSHKLAGSGQAELGARTPTSLPMCYAALNRTPQHSRRPSGSGSGWMRQAAPTHLCDALRAAAACGCVRRHPCDPRRLHVAARCGGGRRLRLPLSQPAAPVCGEGGDRGRGTQRVGCAPHTTTHVPSNTSVKCHWACVLQQHSAAATMPQHAQRTQPVPSPHQRPERHIRHLVRQPGATRQAVHTTITPPTASSVGATHSPSLAPAALAPPQRSRL